MKKRFQILGWFQFSHHPLCERYESHVFRIHFKKKNKTLYLCQGCTLNAIGWLIGLLTTILGFIRFVDYRWYHLLMIMGAILIPILLVELSEISNRPIKRIIRTMGGLGLGFYTALIFDFTSDWWLNIISLGILIPSYVAFLVVRKRKQKKKDICDGCAELVEVKNKPSRICSGLLEKVEAEKEYSKYASDLLQEELRKVYSIKYNPLDGEN